MLTQTLILVLNHLLRGESWAIERLRPFSGRTARIVAAPFRLTFLVNPDGTVAEAAAQEPDVEIRLASPTPLNALRGREATLDGAIVTGASDFGGEIAFVLRNLRWDFEEDLSRIVGDIPARRIGNLTKRLSKWQGEAIRNVGENVAEYLREEKKVLTARSTLGELGSAIDTLREDLDALEKRVAALSARSRP